MTIRGEAPGRGSPAQATDGLADLLRRIAARDAAAAQAARRRANIQWRQAQGDYWIVRASAPRFGMCLGELLPK